MRLPECPYNATKGNPPGVGRGGCQKCDAKWYGTEQNGGCAEQKSCGGKCKTAQNLAEQAALAVGLSDVCIYGAIRGTRPSLGAVGILAGMGTVIHMVLLYVNGNGGRFETDETIILQKPYAFCHIPSPHEKNSKSRSPAIFPLCIGQNLRLYFGHFTENAKSD